ncbi:MAG: hypothetical protein Q8O32_00875 [bacterium]|nr:hypothetical protein [bacterium]
MNSAKKNFAYHPLLISLAPIISFYDHNKDIVSFQYLIRPLLISFSLSVLVFVLLNIIIKNHKKSAIIVSIYIVSFFLYSFYSEIFKFVDPLVDYDSLSLVIGLFFWLAILFLVAKSQQNFGSITKYLNIFSLIIIIIPTASLAYYNYQTSKSANLPSLALVEGNNEVNKPDIYYIILDGYGRQDVLKEIYNYDNSEFINWLENKGFFVAEKSSANYTQTYLSMTASLNLNYLDKMQALDPKSKDRKWLRDKLKNNYVYDFLKEKNYTFVSLPSTWTGNYKNIKADLEIKNNFKNNDFEDLLLEATPLSIFLDPEKKVLNYKEKMIFIFDELGKISQMDENTFVYAHLLMPHPPFIFSYNGNLKYEKNCIKGLDGNHYYQNCPGMEKYRQSYVEQLQYTNKKTMETIEYILKNSDKEPIIILQADHGAGSMLDWESLEKTNLKERFSILNAYYTPEETKNSLSDDITPVNSFRIIFNSVFGTNFEILENKNYFSTWNKPYELIDITNKL